MVLDVLLERQPFFAASARVLARIEKRDIVGLIGATTLTTIFYLVQKAADAKKAREAVRDLLRIFEVVAVDRAALDSALAAPIHDFEDAVLVESGRAAGAAILVTRNGKDFQRAGVEVFEPEEFEAILVSRDREKD